MASTGTVQSPTEGTRLFPSAAAHQSTGARDKSIIATSNRAGVYDGTIVDRNSGAFDSLAGPSSAAGCGSADTNMVSFFGVRTSRRNKMLVIALLCFVVIIGLCLGGYYLIGVEQGESKKDRRSCNSPFGTFCGCTGMVAAYSNCNGAYMSLDWNYINVTVNETFLTAEGLSWTAAGAESEVPPLQSVKNPLGASKTVEVYTGMSYQCVEFSRRFLISSSTFGKYVTFGDVVGASDIFPLTTVKSIFNSSITFDFQSIKNGASDNLSPQFGDLVIYPIQGTINEFPYGHVAVVTYVDTVRNVVGVGEQNWNNKPWPVANQCNDGDSSNDYAREIPLVYDADKRSYSLVDHTYLIDGWKRVGGRL